MTENQHPLTDEIINPHHDPRPWQDCTRADIREGDFVETLIRGLTTRIGVAHRQDENGDWFTKDGMLLTLGDRRPLRRIPAHTTEKDPPMPENTTPAEPLARTLLAVPEGHGAPHHDASRIKAGDYVLQVDKVGGVRHGLAHHQDEYGDWQTEDGAYITWAGRRAHRPDAITVWPAPTPPAVAAGDVITAARPHLTADDLRDTPAGRVLRAEAWDAAWERAWGPAACELTPNPYRTETPDE